MEVIIIYYIVSLITALIHLSNGAKILAIFPLPAKSHFTCNNAIMKSLIQAGHDVTVITAFPDKASGHNYTSVIDIAKNEFIHVGQRAFDEFLNLNYHQIVNSTTNTEKLYCHKVMNLPIIQEIFNSNKKLYDVVFIEIIFLYKCYLPIAKKMNIPVIGTVTMKLGFFADQSISNPYYPAFVPHDLDGSMRQGSFHDRLHNSWNFILSKWFWYFKILPILKQFHLEYEYHFGPITEYINMEPSLIFYNNHNSLIPRPMNPNAIQIGGIHVNKAKRLPENIQKFIDQAKHGAILFSFGSLVRTATMSVNKQEAFKEAFAEIPQRVIWKFEEKMENVPSNVMVLDWLPQRDILDHNNVIAFISHCGQGGIYEAVYSATPIISCPLAADQMATAVLLENLGVSVPLDINSISKQTILQALNSIINDTRYRDKMHQLSEVFKDQPMSPQQSVIYWTEYVIRHKGANHLKTAAVHLNWFQYLLLDVICFLLICFLTCALIVHKIVKSLLEIFFNLITFFYKNQKNKSL